MKILITGQAGFIGFHAALRFKEDGWEVHGIDNFNDYYDVNLKQERLKKTQNFSAKYKDGWKFIEGDLQDKKHRRVGKRINEYLTKDE